jgi:1-acyl-sn-glycerol-3-phosphate acyltransferase
VSNHSSHLDAPMLLCALPGRVRSKTAVTAAADYFFESAWRGFSSALAFSTVPIERRGGAPSAAPMNLLKDGWNLVIFPEGGRSPDGWGQPFHAASAAYLSTRTGRPVVPVHLHGTRDILPKGRGGLRRVKTTVTFGAPLWPGPDEDARKLGRRIEASVAALADEADSDWWSARRRAAAGTTPSLRGPEVAPWRRSWALPGRDDDTAPPGTGDGRRTPVWPRRP